MTSPNPSRRAFLTTGAALTATAGAPLALAQTVELHPDADLIAMGEEWAAAARAAEEAQKAHNDAEEIYIATLGAIPAELIPGDLDVWVVERVPAPSTYPFVWKARRMERTTGRDTRAQTWTADLLRHVLGHVPAILPNMPLERWQAAIPVAEAFERKEAALAARLRLDDLVGQADALWEVADQIQDRIIATPPRTAQGLAVLARCAEQNTRHIDIIYLGASTVALMAAAIALGGEG